MALERLAPLVLAELRGIADRHMRRERVGHTLQTTALVNEAFVRLAGRDDVPWRDRGHFFAACARIMRNVLIDHARARARDRRGGGALRISLDERIAFEDGPSTDVVELDAALRKLEAVDPRKSRIVELRFFAGLSIEETADALDISPMTVRREWRRAKAWLYRWIVEGMSDETRPVARD